MKIKQSELPLDIRRRAAQHLESVRGTELCPNADDLYLDDNVCPIFRPDLEGFAYFEFTVRTAARADAAQGFIIVSAADHDFPVSHWSLDGQPVSTEIEKKAGTKNKKVKKIYKLDALTYTGEDDSGEEAATLGQIPGTIKGLPEHLKGFQVPAPQIKAGLPPDILKQSKVPALEIKAAGRWSEYKANYKKEFKPLLDSLKNKANRLWDIERAVLEFGEGIMVGEPFYVAVLERDFTFEVKGEAAEYVKTRIIKRQGNMAAIELKCLVTPFNREANFSLIINYKHNKSEKLDFFIVDNTIPSSNKPAPKEED